jgi:hypothetical protein
MKNEDQVFNCLIECLPLSRSVVLVFNIIKKKKQLKPLVFYFSVVYSKKNPKSLFSSELITKIPKLDDLAKRNMY